MLADKCAAIEATGRRGLHRRRQLVPAADRRRPLARGARRRAPSTSPRSSRRDDDEPFPKRRGVELANAQLRANLRNATDTIRDEARARRRRAARLGGAARGRPRDQGRRARAPRRATCVEFEAAVEAAGGHVHWARDAAEANAVVAEVARAHGVDEVVKVKSLTTDEIELNDALAAARHPRARDRLRRADPAARRRLVVAHPRAGDPPQPHARSATSSRARSRPASPPTTRATSPRRRALYLRERFLARAGRRQRRELRRRRDRARSASSSPRGTAACARRCRRCSSRCSGSRSSCRRFADLEVFLQLLPRSSTGERMNPYTSLWTGVTAGDGPQELHVVLLDNGRTRVLADEVGRQALHCIRCSACLNVCPVYSRTGGHAYGSVYPGPIGAILTPQLRRDRERAVAAVRVEPLRRLLRGLPGQDRHPEVLLHLRATGGRGQGARAGASGDAGCRWALRRPAPVRAGAAARPARAAAVRPRRRDPPAAAAARRAGRGRAT